VLRDFTAAKGIDFPLLSDVGSRVITELGLRDEELETHHAGFGIKTSAHQQGVAYPAVFVLDESGTVSQKRIQVNYRAREGTRQLLEAVTHGSTPASSGNLHELDSTHVNVRAYTDSAQYVRWERTRLHVELEIDPGWHVYGRPIPDGYTPLMVEINEEEGLAAGEPEYPPVRPFQVEGLDEEFNVYEGRLHLLIPFAVNVAAETGARTLRVSISWQACSESECLMPAMHLIEIVLEEAPPG
jgi:DsbC/DsbD-like thiol-disulfide interchange protein